MCPGCAQDVPKIGFIKCGKLSNTRVVINLLARRLMAGHRSLAPAVMVRIHPGQLFDPSGGGLD